MVDLFSRLLKFKTFTRKYYVPPDITKAKDSKDYYSKYLADGEIYDDNEKLTDEILSYHPKTVLEFGAGVGKNLLLLKQKNRSLRILGIDISKLNVKTALVNCIKLGDESLLKSYKNLDVVFTCSVLDHIEHIDDIIKTFKEIAKVIILMETNSYDVNFYYKHDYESYGFKKVDYQYKSIHGDGAIYEMWKYEHG